MNRKTYISISSAVIFVFLSSFLLRPFENTGLSPSERAEELLKQLTLDEKEALMMNSSKAIPRLGIRKYDWWNEALHGVARNGTATVFPQAVGMAASFDDQLLYNVFSIVSDEARVKHRIARENGEMKRYAGLTMWTPNINIFRDPRWGRGQETYGEDPYLTAVMGVAVIKGLQGENTNGIDKLHACAKHYAVHSGPEWNRHSFDAKNISQRDLWETYLPAFKDAVKKGKVKEVMCAYNRFEGDPCCGSDQLLIQILREQWGYEGIVLSDCGAIDNFYREGRHMTHSSQEHAVSSAILSGTDLECGSSYKSITDAVHAGLISEQQIDISLKRLLKARFELGEMDGTSPWDHLPDSLINCKEHQGMALHMARKSMVLLKNNGILPLKSTVKKIAVLGPNADDAKMQWGNYNGIPKHTVTLLEALKNHLPETEIVYEKLCGHTGISKSLFDECGVINGKKGIEAVFWNNIHMKGGAAEKITYRDAIKIGKRDTISPNIHLSEISARLKTTFTPTVSGEVIFVFTTGSEVKLSVDGENVDLEHIPKSLKVHVKNMKAGKKYQVEVDWVHKKQGEFRFDILRDLEPDYAKINNLVKNANVVVFAGGITSALEKEDANVYAPGFVGGDRTSIELPRIQRNIISNLKKAGKKIVLVNYSGSAMGLVPENNTCDAILQAWYPGEAGGTAIVDILFGKYNPAGRLPVTFYKNVEQLPGFEDYSMTGRTYRYMIEEPLFPFGYGLSYTTFKYGKPELDQHQVNPGGLVTMTIPVTNTGNMDGEEVIQVYLKKLNDMGGPKKALRSFKRISIPAGGTKYIEFELTPENLEWWDEKQNIMHMHPGNYQIMVGGSSHENDLTAIDLKID